MKKRKLFIPYISRSWQVFAAGAAAWLLTVLFFRIKSMKTGDPYIFEYYGSADLVTPVIMMLMGIFSSIPYYGGCISCNVSRFRAADPIGLTGAVFSLIYTILDIIAVKLFIPPSEDKYFEFDYAYCFFEGEQNWSPYYSFDELLDRGLIIFPVMYSFIFFLSMWMCGAVIARAFVNGEKTTAVYETAALLVFILLLMLLESKNNIHGVTGSVIDSLQWLFILLMVIIVLTDLPVFIFMIVYILVRSPKETADKVAQNTFIAGSLNLVLLLILWLMMVRRKEIYIKKKDKNGGDDDA